MEMIEVDHHLRPERLVGCGRHRQFLYGGRSGFLDRRLFHPNGDSRSGRRRCLVGEDRMVFLGYQLHRFDIGAVGLFCRPLL